MAKAATKPSPSTTPADPDGAAFTAAFTVAARVYDPNTSLADAVAAVAEFGADAKRLASALGHHAAEAKGHADLHGFLHRSASLISEVHFALASQPVVTIDAGHLPPRP